MSDAKYLLSWQGLFSAVLMVPVVLMLVAKQAKWHKLFSMSRGKILVSAISLNESWFCYCSCHRNPWQSCSFSPPSYSTPVSVITPQGQGVRLSWWLETVRNKNKQQPSLHRSYWRDWLLSQPIPCKLGEGNLAGDDNYEENLVKITRCWWC